jgi:hypothetical protein
LELAPQPQFASVALHNCTTTSKMAATNAKRWKVIVLYRWKEACHLNKEFQCDISISTIEKICAMQLSVRDVNKGRGWIL